MISKKPFSSFFMVFIFLAFISSACTMKGKSPYMDVKPIKNESAGKVQINNTHSEGTTGTKPVETTASDTAKNEGEHALNQDNSTATQPDTASDTTVKSGPVSNLPWEDEENFKNMQQKADAPVLMAAYRTVLRDPLPGEEENVHLAADMLAGIIIKPGEVFSQNLSIGPYTTSRGFKKGPTYIGSQITTTIGGGVCKIASTLYNVAVLSNLTIVERHCHSMPVPYVPYGQDATVSYGSRDLKFKNSASYPVMIWAKGIDNILHIGFYGKSKPPEVMWNHETLDTQKASVIYRRNPKLPKGTEETVIAGMDGATVRSWLTIENPDGTIITKNLGNSYYKPMPYIIETGG